MNKFDCVYTFKPYKQQTHLRQYKMEILSFSLTTHIIIIKPVG